MGAVCLKSFVQRDVRGKNMLKKQTRDAFTRDKKQVKSRPVDDGAGEKKNEKGPNKTRRPAADCLQNNCCEIRYNT